MTAEPSVDARLAAALAELEESRDRFRTIVTNAEAVIFVLDEHGVFELSEGRGLRLLGLRPGQVVGLSALDLYSAYPDIVASLRHALDGQVSRVLIEVQGAAFDMLCSPRIDATGRRCGMIGLATDITDRVRVERELARQAEELRKAQAFTATLAAISQAFLTLDEDAGIYQAVLGSVLLEMGSPHGFIGYLGDRKELVCPAMTHPFSEGLLRRGVFRVFPESAWRTTLWGRAIATGTVHVQNEVVEVPTDHLTIQRCLVLPIAFHDASIGVVVVANRSTRYETEDVNRLARMSEHLAPVMASRLQRQRSEHDLRESEARLNESQRVARIGHLVYDIERESWEISPTLAEILGVPPGSASDFEHWFGVVHPADAPRLRRYLAEEVMTGKSPFDQEYRVVRGSDGAVRWMHAKAAGEHGPDGKLLRVFGTVQDVTERKQAEQEREKLQAELLQAQKLESIGRLAGGVAHDFNNMLLAILGNVSLALEQVTEGYPLREYLEEIQTAAERSAELTRQLLAFARRQTVSPRVLDLNETVAATLKLLQRLIGEQIQLVWRPGATLCPVEMDPTQVDQILANLTVNARDAIGGPGTITIETSNVALEGPEAADRELAPGEYVMLSVSDTGPGMDDHVRERLFEPFFTTKEIGHGTGLGLATVFGIVKQNFGHIEVISEPGLGATFRIYLRRTERVAEVPPATVEAPPRTGHETVLIAEDEEQVLALARRILSRSGYRVLVARSPNEALALSEANPGTIDLLVSDVVMPGMNGKQLRDEVERLQPGVRCIFMSGYTANVIAHQGVLDHGVAFLQKPFSARTLSDMVRAVLDAADV